MGWGGLLPFAKEESLLSPADFLRGIDFTAGHSFAFFFQGSKSQPEVYGALFEAVGLAFAGGMADANGFTGANEPQSAAGDVARLHSTNETPTRQKPPHIHLAPLFFPPQVCGTFFEGGIGSLSTWRLVWVDLELELASLRTRRSHRKGNFHQALAP